MIQVDVNKGSWLAGKLRRKVAGKKPFRLIAAGDICPSKGRKLDELFAAGRASAEAVYGDTLPELRQKDLSVANLELALSEAGEPIIKDGPNLRGPPVAIQGLPAGGFDVACMANNHVLDFGPEALRQTIALAEANGLGVVGAGETEEKASQPLVLMRAGVRVALLAFAENEFSNATAETPGAAPLRPGPNAAIIRAVREKCHLLVVFVHGGSEYCPIPSPRMVRDCRSFIDAGADAVIVHHAHTVQGLELYRDAPILYNLGNFLFWADDERVSSTWWHEMFVRLTFAGRRCERLDIHPVRLDPATAHASLLAGEARRDFLTRLNRLSEIIADPGLHRRFWNAYCLKRLPFYLGRIRETRDGLDRPDLRRLAAAHLRNLFTCEAHWDVISNGLELARQGLDGQSFGVEEELTALMGGKK